MASTPNVPAQLPKEILYKILSELLNCAMEKLIEEKHFLTTTDLDTLPRHRRKDHFYRFEYGRLTTYHGLARKLASVSKDFRALIIYICEHIYNKTSEKVKRLSQRMAKTWIPGRYVYNAPDKVKERDDIEVEIQNERIRKAEAADVLEALKDLGDPANRSRALKAKHKVKRGLKKCAVVFTWRKP